MSNELTKKIHDWDGQDLEGLWEITYKIDGVRAISDGKNVTSKHGKPLYNLDHLAHTFRDAEIFRGGFKRTIESVRSSKKVDPVQADEVYSLDPLDPRLRVGVMAVEMSAERIEWWLDHVVSRGYEGLILRQGDRWIKVKKFKTYDVTVTGVQEGKGKHTGRMGALITEKGKVGGGFTDEMRERTDWIGKIIEVKCMELTADGKFRHARYLRTRDDK